MKKVKEPLKKASSTSSASKKVDQLKYWTNEDEYELGEDHPHRQLIIDVLRPLYPFVGLLEVGCNAGQNLKRIQEVFPETQMAGVDVNDNSILKAVQNIPQAILKVGEATNLPFDDKSFDTILYDAVLMYVKDIDKALEEARRVARKAIIILDWQSKKTELIGHSIARDYEKLLPEAEFIKITKDTWPTSEKWQKYGQLIVVPVA